MTQTSGLLGVNLTDTPTTQAFVLGTTVEADNGQQYVYVKASTTAITQYDVVGIDAAFVAAPLTKAMADDGWGIGFAQVAFAKDDYGWVATRGAGIRGRLGAACAADVSLYTSATAGVLDDSSTGQTKIDGVVNVTLVGSSIASSPIIATYPRSSTF